MERLAIMVDAPVISSFDLAHYAGLRCNQNVPMTLGEQLDAYEKKLILDTLKKYDGNKAAAAQALGINRTTLYSKFQKYGI